MMTKQGVLLTHEAKRGSMRGFPLYTEAARLTNGVVSVETVDVVIFTKTST